MTDPGKEVDAEIVKRIDCKVGQRVLVFSDRDDGHQVILILNPFDIEAARKQTHNVPRRKPC